MLLSTLLFIGMMGTLSLSGCELWGYQCQNNADCQSPKVCDLGYCQSLQYLQDAGVWDSGPQPSDGRFIPKSCECKLPACEAQNHEACKQINGCVWQKSPSIGGPELCTVHREVLCKRSEGTWKLKSPSEGIYRCECPKDRWLYGEALCLPMDCTGGCQDLPKDSYFSSVAKVQKRAQMLQQSLVQHVSGVQNPPVELTLLRGKKVGQPLPVQQRILEAVHPARWRVTDHYLITPLLDDKNAIDTWLILNGDDATLREIVTFPPHVIYPQVSAKEAAHVLKKRFKKDMMQRLPFAVEVLKKENLQGGLQTLQLFPFWMFRYEKEVYFVTSYKRSTGKPIIFRSMDFVHIPH